MLAITACEATCPAAVGAVAGRGVAELLEGVDDAHHRPEQPHEGRVVADGGEEREPALEPPALERRRALHPLVGRLRDRDRRGAARRPATRAATAGLASSISLRAVEVPLAEPRVEIPRERFEIAAPTPQVEPAFEREREAGHDSAARSQSTQPAPETSRICLTESIAFMALPRSLW